MALARAIAVCSDGLASVERLVLVALMAIIVLLSLGAVAARLAGVAIAWTDEAAVLAMAWACFLGAALLLRRRMDVGVGLLRELLPAAMTRWLAVLVSALLVAFGAVLSVLCWWWFDPLHIIEAGFDTARFQGETFNFIYSDVTPTLGLPSWWAYLVMPWFALSLLVHGTANLIEDIIGTRGQGR